MTPLVLAGCLLASSPVMRRKVETPDGFALALYRYPAAGRAVLLVPDVGLGRETYDVGDTGLARYLAAHGRDTYVVELRGQGQAAVAAPWHLGDWVKTDLPSAVAAVRAAHPGPVDLVAYGWAGTLALAASTHEIPVRRVVALATPVRPEVPNELVRSLLQGGGRFSRLALDPTEFRLVFAEGGRFPTDRVQRLRGAFCDLSPVAAAELLGWMEKGDLTLPDGSTVLDRLAAYDRPTLEILGLLDDFAHPEFGSPLRELAPKAKVKVRLLSRWELLGEDYSHLSLVLGEGAPEDVWAPALRFLDAEGG